MTPKKTEWKSWSASDKVAYIAQIVAILTLFPTVLFAWLGWREARNARLEQAKFFQAVNTPEVELDEVKLVPTKLSQGILFLKLKNTGSTAATQIKLRLFFVGKKDSFWDNVKSDDIFNKLALPKGKDFELPIIKVEDLEREIGWRPTSVQILPSGTMDSSDNESQVLILVSFVGALEESYERLYSINLVR
jgi:hypothetical protein